MTEPQLPVKREFRPTFGPHYPELRHQMDYSQAMQLHRKILEMNLARQKYLRRSLTKCG
jgi:hypothetical protein